MTSDYGPGTARAFRSRRPQQGSLSLRSEGGEIRFVQLPLRQAGTERRYSGFHQRMLTDCVPNLSARIQNLNKPNPSFDLSRTMPHLVKCR